MKKYVMQLILGAAILPVFLVLFAHCESDASEMAQLDALVTDDRGNFSSQARNLCFCLNNQYPVETLSAKEREALLYMREEEKLARDVYTVFYEKWNTRVFANIAAAEQQHMDAILCLIKKYNLNDPVGNNPAGVFQNANLQTLYNTLVAEGAQAPAALAVGAKIEDLDIYDLMRAKPDIDNADVRAVFDELTRGSRNHLRAFVQNLDRFNQTYTPQFISAELFQEITGTPRETGTGLCGTCPNKGAKACPGQGQGNTNCPNGPGNGTCVPGGNGRGNGGNGPGPGNGGNGNGKRN